MNPHNQKSNTNSITQGLFIIGTVIDRTRRMVPRDKPTTEIVTYTIQDSSNHKFFVDDYAPDKYHDLDSYVNLPVFIKAYIRKNGDPSYTINVQKSDIKHGEHF